MISRVGIREVLDLKSFFGYDDKLKRTNLKDVFWMFFVSDVQRNPSM